MSYDERSEEARANDSSPSLSVASLYEELQDRINHRMVIANSEIPFVESEDPWERAYDDMVDQVLQTFNLYVGVRILQEEVKSYVS
jgi:hypothetical protein